ncbi:hypothetical protein SLEP1_g55783 [Rubroshorea leprosula]|uniref:Uncharacterized protein n=1 Tax=Rubroshorea leprosula TaxID=152421 RepID=A0AAV5MHG2_9ROSI|nr:hypothetical protein SLEP1_g55783 [Rubroshorea leprosula]
MNLLDTGELELVGRELGHSRANIGEISESDSAATHYNSEDKSQIELMPHLQQKPKCGFCCRTRSSAHPGVGSGCAPLIILIETNFLIWGSDDYVVY